VSGMNHTKRRLCRAAFIILYNEPTNAQLIHNLLYCSYMFRHYCVIFRELIVSTLLRYMSMESLVIHTQTQYIPGRHNDSINIQTVRTVTIKKTTFKETLCTVDLVGC
jgi:hypothetical protein